jgi:hypothetical protein
MISQWIMLGTDTEIQEEEAQALRNSGHWGKIYEIKPQGDRHSELVEAEVLTWKPSRSTQAVGVS